MIPFKAPVFCEFVRDLHGLETRAAMSENTDLFPPTAVNLSAGVLQLGRAVTTFFELPMTEARRMRVVGVVEGGCTMAELQQQMTTLRETFEDELQSKLVLCIPADRAKYFSNDNLFGGYVALALPRVIEDVDEAGKCFAAGRFTACVFHLMRVLEVGVQELASLLGVPTPEDKMWGR